MSEYIDEVYSGLDDVLVEPSNEVLGISGKVTSYAFTTEEVPSLTITDINLIQDRTILTVLKGMVNASRTIDQTVHVYVQASDGLYSIGKIAPVQIKHFLLMIGVENVIGITENNTELRGNLLYVMATES